LSASALRVHWSGVRVALRSLTSAPDAHAALPSSPDGRARLAATAVVFSKDRALQLDACLRSIERFAPYDGPIAVLYATSDDQFEQGYRELELPDRVTLRRESDFDRDVRQLLADADEHVVFHTDDDVFFREASPLVQLSPELACFSLRLGVNTTHSYPRDRRQALPAFASGGGFLVWEWARADGDFGYPMSLDGHIFRTALVRRLLERATFKNPNALEEELALRRHHAPRLMASYAESCLVSLPLNVVTSSHQNRFAADAALSPASLNERFLAGERIDLDAMDFTAVRGAHQVVELAFAR
jgi:hypothetical protein